MEHCAHELEILTLSVTGDVSLPLNIIAAAMMYLLHVPFIVDVRARKDGGPYGPSYFRGLAYVLSWRENLTKEVS